MNSILKFSAMPTCESLLSGGTAEPLNQLTALVVSLFGVYAMAVWRKVGRRDPVTLLLCVLAVMVGVGGFIFHAQPSPARIAFEVAPPALFMLACFGVVLSRMFGFDLLVTVLNICAFGMLGALAVIVLPADSLGGGAIYIAPLLSIYIAAVGLIIRARIGMHEDATLAGVAAQRSDAVHFPRLKAGYGLLHAGILLALALAARALDAPFCGAIPGGFHMVWHVLAGLAAARILLICVRFPHDDHRPAGLVAQ